MKYDGAANRCVEIADHFHYSPYAAALDGTFAAALLCLLLGTVAIFRGEPFWPFTLLRQRRYDRTYAAAIVVLLGYYGYSRLSAADQVRVDDDIRVQRIGNDGRLDGWMWDSVGALRAVAMARLGIEPAGVKESWDTLLKRWPSTVDLIYSGPDWWLPAYDLRAANVLMDYRAYEPATEAAKTYLRQAGLEIPDFDPGFEALNPANPISQSSLNGNTTSATR